MSKYRTIFISDLHLGTKGADTEAINLFLKENTSESLYLIGDIIDGWRLKSSFYWPQENNNIVRKILGKAKKGTHVVYVTGNHDEFLRNFTSFHLDLGNISIVDEAEFISLDGNKYLVTHGDDFDGIIKYHKWLALLGDWAYNVAIWVNRHFNQMRRRFGLGYWSLSHYLKVKVKTASNFINQFESSVSQECKKRGYQGVFCGHIHYPEIKQIDGILYCNTGDWIESCTAIVEHWDGKLELIRWKE